MSMSTQPQQPTLTYPTVTIPPPSSSSSSSSSHHSNGSFGTVFIVLAVIVVISGISCCLGRLCNRRFNKQRHSKKSHNGSRSRERDMEFDPNKQSHMNHNIRPRERERERDIEFGFDKNIAASKPVVNGQGQPRGFKMSERGDIKFDPKFVSFAEAAKPSS
ncbi:hypothetical protein Dsin_010383 [Dipteronia sinensis]|uniref:Transmembrane protein n=1 Tax=Dipteronia sinensis TaxID=43782 RepID=A0AAE0ECI8_9ROSI|nr:hypothetical protein Dsin_010383 [Dipteronia sinensis]